jgi:WW domain-binding protein 4
MFCFHPKLAGKWVTQEEAYKSVQTSKTDVGQSSTSQMKAPPAAETVVLAIKGGPAPGRVVTKPLNPTRPIRGTAAPSRERMARPRWSPRKRKRLSKNRRQQERE